MTFNMFFKIKICLVLKDINVYLKGKKICFILASCKYRDNKVINIYEF